MKAYEINFNKLDDNWLVAYPWGTPDGEQGIISNFCLDRIANGLKMTVIPFAEIYNIPRIFWKGIPFSYGLFEAEMTVSFQSAVPDFVLYSKVHYKRNIRSILPEIDIAEFGTKNHPDKMNMAVHRWQKNPSFIKDPKYRTEQRHTLDYVGHKQTNKTIKWNEQRTLYQCEVTKKSVKIYVDGIKQFHKRIKLEASFTPSFGISIPKWISNPKPSWMIVHNFSVEQ